MDITINLRLFFIFDNHKSYKWSLFYWIALKSDIILMAKYSKHFQAESATVTFFRNCKELLCKL